MVQCLRKMRAAGCNDTEIALALQTTRGAVNGKRFRLGLTDVLDDPLTIVLRRNRRQEKKKVTDEA